MKKNSIGNPTLNFEECELALLRSAVDKADERRGRKEAN